MGWETQRGLVVTVLVGLIGVVSARDKHHMMRKRPLRLVHTEVAPLRPEALNFSTLALHLLRFGFSFPA